MRKGGGGIGMIVLLVAVLIVLLLVARAWSNMAPQALQVSNPESRLGGDDAGTDGGPGSGSPGHLPDLQEMNQETSQHQEDVREAMEAIP